MRTPELGVVGVMMVVRALPDAAGAENQNPKDSHQAFGQAGVGQDRLMLLIVINHKKPENQESCEKTADDLSGQMEVEKRSRQRHGQQKPGRKHTPPTRRRGIHCVRFGCQN